MKLSLKCFDQIFYIFKPQKSNILRIFWKKGCTEIQCCKGFLENGTTLRLKIQHIKKYVMYYKDLYYFGSVWISVDQFIILTSLDRIS